MLLALAIRLERFSLCRGAPERDPVAGDRPDWNYGRKANWNNEFRVGLHQRSKVRSFSGSSFRERCSWVPRPAVHTAVSIPLSRRRVDAVVDYRFDVRNVRFSFRILSTAPKNQPGSA